MRLLHLLCTLALTGIFSPKGVHALPWNSSSTDIEIRRDDYNGQHVYLTFKEGAVKMMRAALPNNWKIQAVAVSDVGFVLTVEGKSPLCFTSQSFGRVYGAVMPLEKEDDSKKAEIWESHAVACD